MSLEAEIKTLNTNIVALIAALSTGGSIAQPGALVPAKPAAAPAAAPAPAPDTSAVITFDTLKKKVLDLAAKDEPKAMAIMAKFGGKLPATKPEDYPTLNTELDWALIAANKTAVPAGGLV